jgi:GAF domain-containing protein
MTEQARTLSPQRDSYWLRLGNFLVAPPVTVTDLGDQQRARLAATVTLIVGILTTLAFIISGLQENDWATAASSFGIVLVATYGAYALTRTRFFAAGALIFVLGFCAALLLMILKGATEDPGRTVLIFMPLGLIVGSFLLNWRLLLAILALLTGAFLLLPSAGIEITGSDWAALGVTLAVGLVLILFSNYRAAAERSNIATLENANRELATLGRQLEQRVEERTTALNRRTAQLEAASFVSRQTASILDPSQLLDEVVQLISDRFDYYHAGIFLLDTRGQFAVLQAASSEGGKRMLARGHRLEVGREGIVGYAAFQRRARIALDVGEEAVFFSNPDLPHTRSEMALPLIVRDKPMGVMDIQSTEPGAFAEEDISALQSLADQIALALDNARLLAESQAALKQLQSITAESSYRAWRESLGAQKMVFRYTPVGVVPLDQGPDTTQVTAQHDANTLTVPISLRGKDIGSIIIKRKGRGQHWTEQDQNLLADVSAQVALALENARLLEDLQRRANREQAIARAASHFSQTTDTDTLLQIALREFHQLPSVEEVSVVIGQSEDGRNSE